MINRSSTTSPVPSSLDALDQHTLLRHILEDEQELEELLRKLENGQCPLSLGPADQCDACTKKDPRHYPRGLTVGLRSVVRKFVKRTKDLVLLLPPAERAS
ncbi:MAG: hypothetical protein Q8R32_00850 [bacterium]|nr:hypothetical protein [bacterium]